MTRGQGDMIDSSNSWSDTDPSPSVDSIKIKDAIFKWQQFACLDSGWTMNLKYVLVIEESHTRYHLMNIKLTIAPLELPQRCKGIKGSLLQKIKMIHNQSNLQFNRFFVIRKFLRIHITKVRIKCRMFIVLTSLSPYWWGKVSLRSGGFKTTHHTIFPHPPSLLPRVYNVNPNN